MKLWEKLSKNCGEPKIKLASYGFFLAAILASSALSAQACDAHHPDACAKGACNTKVKAVAQATDTIQSTTTVTQTTTNTSQPLQGSVVKTVKEAQMGLNTLAKTLGQLKHADTELYNEATRQVANLIEEPEIIAGTVIYIPVNFTTGDYLPMRKKWVEYYMTQLANLVPMVQEDIEAILIPDDKEEKADEYITQMKGEIQDIQNGYQILQKLAVGPIYNQNAIAAICHNIDHDIKQMDESRKKAFHAIK